MAGKRDSFRLKIVSLVVATTIGTAICCCLLFHWWSSRVVLQDAKKQLAYENQLLAPYIKAAYSELKNDTTLLAETPPIEGIARSLAGGGVDPLDGSRLEQWRSRLETIFESFLLARPHYVQVRYIGIAHQGRELVRVEARTPSNSSLSERPIARIPPDQLQAKGSEFYFEETLDMPPESFYFSPITPNREHGREVPGQFVLRAVKTIYYQGKPFGLVVINADKRGLMNRMLAPVIIPESRQAFVVTSEGHPLVNREGRGWVSATRSELESSELGRLLLSGEKLPRWVTVGDRIATVRDIVIDSHHSDRKLRVATTAPRAQLLAPVRELTVRLLIVSALIVALCGMIALVIARRLTSPLAAMTTSIQTYATGEGELNLPVGRDDELGELARAFRDLTHALEKALVDADASSRSKGEFLANMSHEIRTPLAAILGYVELLESDEEIRADKQELDSALTTVRTNAHHLMTIINDILDMSKVEAGRMSFEKLEFSLVDLVVEVADLLGPRARGKEIQLEVKYASRVPTQITTDPTRLRQILLNLVGNAIKFTEVGGVILEISCTTDPAQLKIRVEDTGIGMTEAELESITRFEPFTQADSSTTRRYGGTGLGLKISKALVHLLGGNLEVTSEYGRGSVFTFTIDAGDLSQREFVNPDRVRRSDPRSANTRVPADRKSQAAAPLEAARILLVEDAPDNQRLISHFLRRAGAEVEIVVNGQLAIDAVSARAKDALPQLILMDMQMPIRDGYSATQALRELGFNHPIIALTAHAMSGDRNRCLACGCDDFVTKPINRPDFIETCTYWIEKATAPTETSSHAS